MSKKIFTILDPEMEIGFRENRFRKKMYPERNVHYITSLSPSTNFSPNKSKHDYLYDEVHLFPQYPGKEKGNQTPNSYLKSKGEYDKLENQLKDVQQNIDSIKTKLKPINQIRIIKSHQNMPTINNKKLSRDNHSSSPRVIANNHLLTEKSYQDIIVKEEIKTHTSEFEMKRAEGLSLSPSRLRYVAPKQLVKSPEIHAYGINLPNPKFSDFDPITGLNKRDKSPFQSAAKNLISKEASRLRLRPSF
ncbi:unnamed protein product [Blepharisma stoltei]|uniref:Uncharacterized protein n=1 Tax=Blepharisma stoltei TaxID=1481888 RepID=A0AAU9KEY7_9CILI|nr:unnamed protein product [Blepharisma stoltei]